MQLAAQAGLVLDPWQRDVLEDAFGETAEEKWSAFEVGLLVSRQNGKGVILEAVELAGLFLFEEPVIIHSAHLFSTSIEHFRRILADLEALDSDRHVKRVSRAHGDEGVELFGGQRLLFRTRTTGGGKGWSAQRVILDEAQHLSDDQIGALVPTMSAQANPQVWYTATAADLEVAPCEPLTRLRNRAKRGGDKSLCWLEWSAPYDEDLARLEDDPADSRAWAQANPAMGIRISAEHIGREFAALSPGTFARERLGVGRWPVLDDDGFRVIDAELWGRLTKPRAAMVGRVAIAVDVTPDHSRASVAAAGAMESEPDRVLVDVIRSERGTDWLVDRVAKLTEHHQVLDVSLDPAGAAGSLLTDFEAAGVNVRLITAREMAQACGEFFDAAQYHTLAHLGQTELDGALRSARKRDLSGAWAWDRRDKSTDLTPLVAATLARHGYAKNVTANYDLAASIA